MPMAMMMEQVSNYPVDDRVAMADAILASLNGADPAVEAAWASIASRRLRELKSGRVRGVPAGTVFARARRACQAELLESTNQGFACQAAACDKAEKVNHGLHRFY